MKVETISKPDIQITLTHDEAILLRSFVGKLTNTSIKTMLESTNSNPEIDDKEYQSFYHKLYFRLNEVL